MGGNDRLNASANDSVIQWLDFIETLVQFCKTNTTPREPLLQARATVEMRPLICERLLFFIFFDTLLFLLRERLQTRGHKRVFKQKKL